LGCKKKTLADLLRVGIEGGDIQHPMAAKPLVSQEPVAEAARAGEHRLLRRVPTQRVLQPGDEFAARKADGADIRVLFEL
jgi:hypothetical protein